MEPITDKSFTGGEGLVRVWNATNGFLQVCDDGHLLQGQTSAWVAECEIVNNLIEEGLLVALGKNGKQNGNGKKKKITEESAPSEQDSPVQHVAHSADISDVIETSTTDVSEATPVAEETNNEQQDVSVSVETH